MRKQPKQFASVEHLSAEAVAAFVDHELSPGAMHRARIHLVHCPECRAEVAHQRRASERLRTCADSEDIRAPQDLLARLADLASSCPQGPGAEEKMSGNPETLLDRVEVIYRAVRRSRLR
ncbi:anti-sigma factor family protein [Corynebacterium freiburgense]|uniref:anti-sigma factor family protein n=1 Tax=Corynebacterium freiburgense TaxID=556548 RepID=UPI000400F391|nr:zf-HC2 domain-containing protein [Corynebacterium freiburgense]WJZ02289.1 Anti-sigma-E factor RseA [Corynebacterium freiburgense]